MTHIQGYFEYIIKKHETFADNSPIQRYVNRIQNRIKFKIKTGYYLKYFTPKTMQLLASTIIKITKAKNGENTPHLEITDVILVYCNIVNKV